MNWFEIILVRLMGIAIGALGAYTVIQYMGA